MRLVSKMIAKALQIWFQAGCVAIFCSSIVHATPPPISDYFDSFEGPLIDQFWSVRQQGGTVSLSSDQAHGGAQSLKFSSSPGSLIHNFGALTHGAVSVALYDTASGASGNQQLQVFDSKNPWGPIAYVGPDASGGTCYGTGFVDVVQGVLLGGGTQGDCSPNAAFSPNSQVTIVPVRRTPGWHFFFHNLWRHCIHLHRWNSGVVGLR